MSKPTRSPSSVIELKPGLASMIPQRSDPRFLTSCSVSAPASGAQPASAQLVAAIAAADTLPERRTPTRTDWARVASNWQPMLDERIAMLEAMKERLDGCIGCGCLSLDTCALYNPEDVIAARGVGPRYLLGDEPPD